MGKRTCDAMESVPFADSIMNIIGAEHLEAMASGSTHQIKMAFNDRGAIIFSIAHQHREMKADGISYEDDYKGNALAAMLRREQIEIRFHQGFKDADVARIVESLLALPEFVSMQTARVMYQGRTLQV